MNAHEISRLLADNASAVAQHLIPGGKKSSGEWKAGSTSGDPGQSLSIRLTGAKAGVWKDFATGQSGDLLDLWAACKGLSVSEALTEAKAYLGVRDHMPERPTRSFNRPDRPNCKAPAANVLHWLRSRGLEDRTIEDFRIGEQLTNGKTYAIFPYLRDGELVNFKARNPADKRDMRQAKDAEPCLYGWHLIDPRVRTVAICEGELDAMTLHQAGIPALSVNAGAGNHQWIENDWDRLERFSEILIAFDADEAGEKGAAEVTRRLGMERCKRLHFGNHKDANEALTEGSWSGEDFWAAVADAKPQDPAELRQASDFIDRVKALFYPASGATEDPVLTLDRPLEWFEFRSSELTIWTGINGHGKSLMLNQVMLGLMQQGQRFCVFSGEMTPERQLKRLVKQATGTDRPTPAYIDAVGDWLQDRCWLFNQVGSAKLSRLLEVFLYASKRYGIRHFVVDSLMMTDVPEDGAGAITAQKAAVQKLCDFAKANACHVHLVAHPRKGADEKTAPGKLDVAGSSKLTDAADNVFTVWSARKDESEPETDQPDAKLILQKQRNGECQHRTLYLWFVRHAMQFATTSRRKPVTYVDFSTIEQAAA